MQLDALLEVAIGLVMAWLVLSLAVMQIQEWISTLFSWRAKFLAGAIGHMLADPVMMQKLYNHPLIQALSQPRKDGTYSKPSYIPSAQFTAALFDLLVQREGEGRRGELTFAQLDAAIAALEGSNSTLAHRLSLLLVNARESALRAEDALTVARTSIQQWYDDTMDRLSGWYKRHAQKWAFIFGLVLAFAFNVDTVELSNRLWREPTLRAIVVEQATAAIGNDLTPVDPRALDEVYEALSVPIGWATRPAPDGVSCGWLPGQPVQPGIYTASGCRIVVNLPSMDDPWGWLMKFFGLLISGAAAAQGAPFWFDILKRLINLRGSGNTPAPAPVEPPRAAPPPPAPPAPTPVG